METFSFRCPNCRTRLRVKQKYVGAMKTCPNRDCRTSIRIPDPNQLQSARSSQKNVSTNAEQTGENSRKRKPVVAAEKVRRETQATSASARKTNKKPTVAKKKSAKPQRSGSWRLKGIAAAGAVFVIAITATYSLLPSANTGGVSPEDTQVQAEAPHNSYGTTIRPFLETYCMDCHGADLQEGGIRFDNVAQQPDLLANHAMWSKVQQQIAVGSMPPQDVDMPPMEQRQLVADFLDKAINQFDCATVDNAGHVTVRRLNRTEYDNTIRDLLGVDLNLSRNFPSDDVGYGFDTIGDVLSVSPLLMERYLIAAEEASAAAIQIPSELKLKRVFAAEQFETKGSVSARSSGLAYVSNGEATARFETKVPGEYTFTVQAQGSQAGDELARCRIQLDDQKAEVHDVPGDRQNKTITWKATLPAGKHALKIAFTNDFYDPDSENPKRRDRNLYVTASRVEGPKELKREHYSESHRRLVTQTPGKSTKPIDAARQVLGPFLRRAYRRPITDDELEVVLAAFQLADYRGESYERSLQVAVQTALVTPQFLFRMEKRPEGLKESERHVLGDYEMASRLSYFLWSSMPDEELFQIADSGLLQRDEVLDQQVRRMLRDPKAEEFVKNFVGQWLGLRKLGETEPDRELFPMYNEQLAEDMARETEMLFTEILKEDKSVVELINADYTFVNEPLAKLYGLEGVKGRQFRKVSLADSPRRGLISHAGILTLTSFPNRTSPVKRGEWVLENILGEAPPPAPANVPGLEETQSANPNLSFREQLTLHQKDPICSSCHKLMDGIGFGLQNFDAVGRWREQEGEFKIDARGDLPDGSSFNGPRELIQILSAKPDHFTRCMTEKMLTYALGRGLKWYDKCTVDEIVAETRSGDYRMSRLISALVKSPPFRSQQLEQ